MQLFSSQNEHDIAQDIRLFQRALRGGWLSDEKRNELLLRLVDLVSLVANQDNIKGFMQLATLYERLYQSDLKAMVRERKGLPVKQSVGAKAGQPRVSEPQNRDRVSALATEASHLRNMKRVLAKSRR